MRKFYNEPEMAVKRFEAEDIVTASDNKGKLVNSLDTTEYSTATGTLSRNATGGVDLSFIMFN